MDTPFYLEGILDHYEGANAIIALDNQRLIWPKNKLPPETTEGAKVILELYNNKTLEREKADSAKGLLNELLQSHD
ncbi:MAG: hypothetical protein PHD51_03985 [Patescibacteria group bacterium]|nr:hypothetical protein [Patescibacteria group bacterium]MDD5490875.1 hypothetical protein [Patescibacteria group bacterium]